MLDIGKFTTKEESILLKNSIIEWLKNNFSSNKKYRFTLGLSGGSDSSSILSLVTLALGTEAVFVVSIPSKHNSIGTKTDAQKLCDNLKVNLHWANDIINDGLNAYNKQLNNLNLDMKNGSLAYENMQARLRGVLLMQISAVLNDNGYKNWVLNTGNSTEDLLGYYTIQGGDSVGAFSPISLLVKDEVFSLCSVIPEIPQSIWTRKATAELNENQTDETAIGVDFNTSSNILRNIIQNPNLLKNWLKNNSNLTKEEKIILSILKKNSFKLTNFNPIIPVEKNNILYEIFENRLNNINEIKKILLN